MTILEQIKSDAELNRIYDALRNPGQPEYGLLSNSWCSDRLCWIIKFHKSNKEAAYALIDKLTLRFKQKDDIMDWEE